MDLILVATLFDLVVPAQYAFYKVYLLFAYWIVLEASPLQGSLGKWVMGLRVRTVEGHRLTLRQSVWRNFTRFFSLVPLGFGYLFILFSPTRQALHDSLSHTVLPLIPPQEQPWLSRLRPAIVVVFLALLGWRTERETKPLQRTDSPAAITATVSL